MVNEPDAILAQVENEAFPFHGNRIDFQHDGFATSRPRFFRFLAIRGEMHVMASHLLEPLFHDAGDEPPRGTVV